MKTVRITGRGIMDEATVTLLDAGAAWVMAATGGMSFSIAGPPNGANFMSVSTDESHATVRKPGNDSSEWTLVLGVETTAPSVNVNVKKSSLGYIELHTEKDQKQFPVGFSDQNESLKL